MRAPRVQVPRGARGDRSNVGGGSRSGTDCREALWRGIARLQGIALGRLVAHIRHYESTDGRGDGEDTNAQDHNDGGCQADPTPS